VNESPRVVAVEILGQQYPIRSTLAESYVADLAAYVDEKIRSAADVTPTTDTVRLVVLAALNIADECFHALDRNRNGPARAPAGRGAGFRGPDPSALVPAFVAPRLRRGRPTDIVSPDPSSSAPTLLRQFRLLASP
jgi:cell division protein ZapA (FtsZ GTPase activity inhibitor)